MTKYHARRTEYAGHTYASAAEARYAAKLDLWLRVGELLSWHRGRQYVLVDGPTPAHRITYTPDFECVAMDGTDYVVDVKGATPRDFRLRAILWAAKFPDRPLRVVDSKTFLVRDIFARKPRRKPRRKPIVLGCGQLDRKNRVCVKRRGHADRCEFERVVPLVGRKTA